MSELKWLFKVLVTSASNSYFKASHGPPPPTCGISDVKKKEALASEKARNISKSLGPLSREHIFWVCASWMGKWLSWCFKQQLEDAPKTETLRTRVPFSFYMMVWLWIQWSQAVEHVIKPCVLHVVVDTGTRSLCFRKKKSALWKSHGRTCVTEQWITASVLEHVFCSVTCETRSLPTFTW